MVRQEKAVGVAATQDQALEKQRRAEHKGAMNVCGRRIGIYISAQVYV